MWLIENYILIFFWNEIWYLQYDKFTLWKSRKHYSLFHYSAGKYSPFTAVTTKIFEFILHLNCHWQNILEIFNNNHDDDGDTSEKTFHISQWKTAVLHASYERFSFFCISQIFSFSSWREMTGYICIAKYVFQSFPSFPAFLHRREAGERQQYLRGEKNSNLT